MSRPRPGEIHRELELHHKEFYGWALYCSYEDKDVAADVLQTAYLKILEKQSSFEGKSDFRTWAFRIIKNTAHDFSRARERREKLFSHKVQLPETDQVLIPESSIDKAK